MFFFAIDLGVYAVWGREFTVLTGDKEAGWRGRGVFGHFVRPFCVRICCIDRGFWRFGFVG